MKLKSMLSTLIAATVVGGLSLGPSIAFSQDHDKDKDKDKRHSKQHRHNDNGDNGWHEGQDRGRKVGWREQAEYDRRQQTKNDWRNLAIAGGVISVIGLLKHDSTLTFVGAAGALYSAHRYEEDRKSQNRLARGRAFYFGKPYFYRDGHRFVRRTVWKHGQKYYQFCRE
jgi:hypothetical protein